MIPLELALPHLRALAREAAAPWAGLAAGAPGGRLDQLQLLLQSMGRPVTYLMVVVTDPDSEEEEEEEEEEEVVPPRAAAMAARAAQFQPRAMLAWVEVVAGAANALLIARGGWASGGVG